MHRPILTRTSTSLDIPTRDSRTETRRNARIYGKLRTEGPTARLERAVARGVAEARGKPQSFHGVPISNISPSSWNSSVKLLQTVGLFTLPCDKVRTKAGSALAPKNGLYTFLSLFSRHHVVERYTSYRRTVQTRSSCDSGVYWRFVGRNLAAFLFLSPHPIGTPAPETRAAARRPDGRGP